MADPRYPIGKFQFPVEITPQMREQWLLEIEEAPAKISAAIMRLTPAQVDSPYREGGWTARQVVHHVADSHINSYVRFRLALTEDRPAIKSYEEGLWAELSDAKHAPVELSLVLLNAMHTRWTLLLKSLTPEQLQRSFLHPAMGAVTLEKNMALYAWHGKHHTAHILQCANNAA